MEATSSPHVLTQCSPSGMQTQSCLCMHAGCFIAPLTFQLFWHSFDIGSPNSQYKAPFANIYRGMAVIGTQVSLQGAHPLLMGQIDRQIRSDQHASIPGTGPAQGFGILLVQCAMTGSVESTSAPAEDFDILPSP